MSSRLALYRTDQRGGIFHLLQSSPTGRLYTTQKALPPRGFSGPDGHYMVTTREIVTGEGRQLLVVDRYWPVVVMDLPSPWDPGGVHAELRPFFRSDVGLLVLPPELAAEARRIASRVPSLGREYAEAFEAVRRETIRSLEDLVSSAAESMPGAPAEVEPDVGRARVYPPRRGRTPVDVPTRIRWTCGCGAVMNVELAYLDDRPVVRPADVYREILKSARWGADTYFCPEHKPRDPEWIKRMAERHMLADLLYAPVRLNRLRSLKFEDVAGRMSLASGSPRERAYSAIQWAVFENPVTEV